MDRNEILDRKASEIQSLLADWAAAEHLLSAGEKIVFSLRVEPAALAVEQDASINSVSAPKRLVLSNKSRLRYAGEHLHPACLSSEEADEMLEILAAPVAFSAIRKLLVEHGNNPVSISKGAQSFINSLLAGKPIRGKHYRIAKGLGDEYQLWEVRPSAS